MGGRSLLSAPLHVLRTQHVELRVFLADAPWADALRQARIDPVPLVSAIDETVTVATAAIVALRLARNDVDSLTARRSVWRQDYKAWAGEVRAVLKVVGPRAPEPTAEVRRRLGATPGGPSPTHANTSSWP